jgi:hypothetical protein
MGSHPVNLSTSRGCQVSWLVAALIITFAYPCAAAERYLRASIDEAGHLRILTRDGRTITIPKEGDQVGFAQIAISPDSRSIGWVGLQPNCCTSYPIPMQLVVYRSGARRTFNGSGLPVWRWVFTASGNRVAFHQETVHGGLAPHYELRDVATGQLVEEYDPVVGSDNQPLPKQTVPRWVKVLVADRRVHD